MECHVGCAARGSLCSGENTLHRDSGRLITSSGISAK